MTNPKTALVLTGCGNLGAVHAGMLQALSRTRWLPDLVVGESVGALNAAFYAADPTPAGCDRLADLWRGLRRMDVVPLTAARGMAALLLRRSHLVEPARLRRFLQRELHLRRIEDTPIPLHVSATDVMNGEQVVLSTGDVIPALLASTATPVLFPPVDIAGRHLVDGTVGDDTGIAAAVAHGAERILVLPTGSSCATEEPPQNMAALALQVMSMQSMRRLDRDVARYAQRAEITVVPPLCPLDISVFDFSQTAALIYRAADQTRAWLAKGGLGRAGPLHVPLAHHHAGPAPQPTARTSQPATL